MIFRKNKITKMRKRLKDKSWLERRQKQLLDELDELNRFETFQCSAFFRGYAKAEFNQRFHDKKKYKASKHYYFISKLLEQRK